MGRRCSSMPAGSAWKASSRSAPICPTGPAAASIGSSPNAVLRQEFVILGYMPSTAAKGAVGSLLLGYYDGGKLSLCRPRRHRIFQRAGRVAARRRSTRSRPRDPSSATALPGGAEKGVRWVEPQLVCEVEYPRLDGRRVDSPEPPSRGCAKTSAPEEIVLESGAASGPSPSAAASSAARTPHPSGTNPLAGAGVTKQGLAEFYADIADWILAAHHRPRAEPGALSVRREREVLLRQACVAWAERRRCVASMSARRSRCWRSTTSKD